MTAMSPADWQRLRALRDRFLSDASEAYWTPEDLSLYDATFAQRIGWKWDGVLGILDRAGWKPSCRRLLDWGCGTGIAARTVAAWAGIRDVVVHDQSGAAAAFAAASLRGMKLFPQIVGPEHLPDGTLLVISHVLGELDEAECARLAAWAAHAEEILWVEPGARAISRSLSRARDAVLEHGHRVVAPCTHQHPCPMNQTDDDWCHFFAEPPAGVFHSPFWREFSLRLAIDLRALPFSFFASTRNAAVSWPTGAERVIGRARVRKAHCDVLCCGAEGLCERSLQKRDAPGLFREFARHGRDGAFVWRLHPEKNTRILAGEETAPPATP